MCRSYTNHIHPTIFDKSFVVKFIIPLTFSQFNIICHCIIFPSENTLIQHTKLFHRYAIDSSCN